MNQPDTMREEYDFSNAKKNPYVSKLRKQISIRIDISTLEYFKTMAEKTGIAYQDLINLYLGDCARKSREIDISWS